MQWRGSNPKVAEAPAATLSERLQKITSDTAALVPAERLEPVLREIGRLRTECAAARVLKVGDAAPGFELPDHNGNLVRSAELLAHGPVVVSFFRGRWDPYCMTELAAWKDAWPQVQAAGASLLAISPQTAKHTGLVFQQLVTPFPILSDVGNAVARQFRVLHPISSEMRDHMLRVLINLRAYNGDDSWELPLPATFVIAPDATIVFAFADEDYRTRAEPAEVITLLRQLASTPGLA